MAHSKYKNNIINKIININGTYKYAYVVMVINQDIYTSASIIFAESIRKIGCIGDLVVMVDNNISNDAIEILKKYYNKIILIENIKIKNINPIQKIILSKINAFNLIEYDKIFLIDVDTILFTNIDNLFIDFKVQIPSINYLGDKKNYGFILIKPSVDLYLLALELINKYKITLETEKKPFGFIIDKLFKKISKLNIDISCDKFSNTDGIQYITDKPFLMSSDLTIENRMRLDHFKIWFSYLANILNKYPELRRVNFLQEPIIVSKYFLASISRFIVNFIKLNKNKKKNEINNIYGKNEKINNLDYYYLDITKEYSTESTNLNPIIGLNEIGFNFFLEYMDKISNIKFIDFKICKNISEIIEKTENNNNLIGLNLFLNQYIKLYPNTFIILEITDILLKKPTKLKELKNNLIYLRSVCLDGFCLKNILFNLYQNYTYNQRIIFLSKFENNINYTINLSLYETINSVDLGDVNIGTNIFILSNTKTKIRFGSIFFNTNTIDMFKNKNKLCICIENTDDFINTDSLIKLIYFQTLKKWIHCNYLGNDIENIMIIDYTNNYYKIIDNNEYDINKINKINKNKIYFIDIIFSKNFQYKNIIKNQKNIVNMIHDPKYYWELEGIKLIKKID